MKKTGKCPKCGCTEIITDAKAVDRGHSNARREMEISTFGNPDAWIFKGEQSTTVSAWVCSDCGYVEYYADYPVNLGRPKP